MASAGADGRHGAHDVELARAVVPELLLRIEGSTQRLERIEARLAAACDDPSEALGAEVDEAEGLGWLLGWIAGGLGAELLLERHEPRALALALELVDAVLRRQGGGLEAGDVPRVSRAGGWRLAWALAGLVWRAGVARGALVCVALQHDERAGSRRLVLDGTASEAVRVRASALERELAGTCFQQGSEGWSWSFPAEWLEAVA